MSSSNRVRLAIIKEDTYGVTPPAGDFTEVRKTSEDLTGTPLISESAEARSDRQTAGQILTGLEITGGPTVEYSDDPSLALNIEMAMMSNVVSELVDTDTLTISSSGTLLTTTGDFTALGFNDGDVVVLGGFAAANNNVPVLLSSVGTTTATITGKGLTDEAGSGDETITRPAYHEIGTTPKSLSISKEFLDLGNRNIAYTGMRVSEMAMNFAFGSIVTGRFSYAGNGYSTPALPITNGRTVNAASTTPPMNASRGFGWLLVDGADIGICMESVDFTLNNGLIAQNCIGELAAADQILGSASVAFNGTFHLETGSWDLFMPAKLAQTPISLAFYTTDDSGNGYAVTMDRVQVSFPDPSSGGRDQSITVSASGTASLDSTTNRTMRIYLI